MLNQQLNCVCNTLAKRSVTSAINNGYHDRQSQLLPKEDVALVYGATKSPAISPPICGSTQVKRWQGNIWPLVPRTSGQTNVSTQWTGNIWTLPSRTRQICTKYGGLNNIQAFVVQGSRSAATPENSSPTRDAQIAEDGRRPPISCFAPTTNAPDYWSRTLMN